MFLKLLAKSISALILIQWVSIATAGDACPEGIIEKVMHTKEMQSEGEILSVGCKKWPVDAARMLIAVAYAPPDYNSSGYDVPFHVGIVRMPQVEVLNHYRGKIFEDATWQTRNKQYFNFDTARYLLADGVRAVALRERGWEAPSAATHGADEKFTLFIPVDNKVLRPVLLIPHMQFWYYELNEQNERTGYFSASLTISVEKTRSNGFADLLVTARQYGSNKVIFTQLLKYDGKDYPNGELIKQINNWWQGS